MHRGGGKEAVGCYPPRRQATAEARSAKQEMIDGAAHHHRVMAVCGGYLPAADGRCTLVMDDGIGPV